MVLEASPIKAALASAAFLLAALSACSTTGSFRSAEQIVAWAEERGFSRTDLHVGKFRLAALIRKPSRASDTLVVYIEGDGAAWPTPYHPPRDPTPTRPVALALAAADPSAAVAYLGRPCQYLSADALHDCDSAYWTDRRFAPEVVAAFDEAVSLQKSVLAARRVKLFGYSGGGAIATLLAARRDDVEWLVTIASPLAVKEWAARHEVSPLRGSLDPVDLDENIRFPGSVHFVGNEDRIVPAENVGSFIRRKGGRMERIPGFDHECCWAKDWRRLLERLAIQENAK